MAYDIGPKIGIDGEAEFRKQINNITATLKALDKEMEAVTTSFGENDDAQERLTAQNKILSQQIELQKKKLTELQKGLEESAQKYGDTDTKTQKWKATVSQATADLNRMEKSLADNKDALAQFTPEAQEAAEALAKAEEESRQAKAELERLAQVEQQAREKTERLKKEVDEAQKSFDEAADTLKGPVSAGFKAALAGATALVTGIVATVQGTAELRGDLSKLEANAKGAGVGFDTANDALLDFNAISGETDSSIEAISNLLQAGFNGNNLAAAVDALSGAVIRFPDTLKIESLADSLQETLATSEATGQFGELLERLGFNLDEFNEGLKACATSTDKQNYALKYLAKGGMMDANDAYQEQNRDLIENSKQQLRLQENMAALGSQFAPLVNRAMEALNDTFEDLNNSAVPVFVDGLEWMMDNGEAVISVLAGLTAGVVAYKAASVITDAIAAFQTMAEAIRTAQAAQTALNVAQLANPIGLVVAGIAALATGVAVLATTMSDSDSETDQYKQRMEELEGQVSDLEVAMDEANATREQTAKSIDAEADANRALLGQLSDLMGVENKSSLEKQKIKNIVDQLNYALPELNLLYDEETDKLNMSKAAIESYITSAEKRLRLQAAEKDMQTIIEQQYEAQKLLVEVTAEQEAATDRLTAARDRYNEAVANPQLGVNNTDYFEALEEAEEDLEYWDEEVTRAEENLKELDERMQAVKKSAEEFAEGMEESGESTGEVTEATAEMTEEMQKLQEQYEQTRSSAESSIQSQIGLFDEINTKSDLTFAQMLQRLGAQATALDNWANNLQIAAQKGIRDGLLETLAQAGPESAGYLEIIANLTEDEIAQLNEAWDKRFNASQYAADEMTAVQMNILNGTPSATAAAGNAGAQGTTAYEANNKMADVASGKMRDTAAAIAAGEPLTSAAAEGAALDASGAFDRNYNPQEGADAGMQSAINAIKNSEGALTAESSGVGFAGTDAYTDGAIEAAYMIDEVTYFLSHRVLSGMSIYADMYNTGAEAVRGYANGISRNADQAINAAAAMAANAIKAAKRAQNSNSPSKEFAKLGEYGSEGYALGFEGKMNDLRPRITRSIQQNIDAASQTSSRGKTVRGQSLTAKDIAKAFQQSGLKLYAGEREIARLQRRLKRA